LDRPRPVAGTRFPRRGLSNGGAEIPLALLAAFTAIAGPLVVTSYGIETNQKAIALIGLVAIALVAALAALSASKSRRARDELRAANDQLRRRNADLEARHRAVAHGLDVIDERTEGRLWELLEETGDELAELVDEALDEPDGDG
jgi:hypothetical protein